MIASQLTLKQWFLPGEQVIVLQNEDFKSGIFQIYI